MRRKPSRMQVWDDVLIVLGGIIGMCLALLLGTNLGHFIVQLLYGPATN